VIEGYGLKNILKF